MSDQEIYKIIYDQIDIPIAVFRIIIDDHHKVKDAIILDCNRKYVEIAAGQGMGTKREDLINRSYFALQPDYDSHWRYYLSDAAIDHKHVRGELRVRETQMWMEVSAGPLPEKNTCWISFIDHTRFKNENEKLSMLSFSDQLTGVNNRNAYEKEIEELSQSHRPLGVVLVDVNGLKQVNDHRGHQQGDELIKNTAQFLSVFSGRNLPYRIGGDEFVLLLPGIHQEELDYIVTMIHSYTHARLSCGASWHEDSSHVKEIIRQADQAMYEEKRTYYSTHDRRRR